MKVYTKSGSCYAFVVYEGSLRTHMKLKEIIVTQIENLEIGKELIVKGYDLNCYGQVNKSEVVMRTSTITRIEV